MPLVIGGLVLLSQRAFNVKVKNESGGFFFACYNSVEHIAGKKCATLSLVNQIGSANPAASNLLSTLDKFTTSVSIDALESFPDAVQKALWPPARQPTA
eukprot:3290385-Pleurochrysis_carterae.AAC.1